MLKIVVGSKKQRHIKIDFGPVKWRNLFQRPFSLDDDTGAGLSFCVLFIWVDTWVLEVSEYVYKSTDGMSARFMTMAVPYEAYEIDGKRFELDRKLG